MKVLLLSGKESPPPLGGLVVPEQTSNLSTRRPEQLLGSKICALMSSCSTMLTSFYPVQVAYNFYADAFTLRESGEDIKTDAC